MNQIRISMVNVSVLNRCFHWRYWETEWLFQLQLLHGLEDMKFPFQLGDFLGSLDLFKVLFQVFFF